MEPLIYYPTFEPPSENWLKFAMLYVENFMPIVPYERQGQVSDNFKRIRNETDLIEFCTPHFNDGHHASINTIEEVDKIFKYSEERSFLFREDNIIRKWQNPANWNFTVYGEKFTQDWSRYCIDNRIGREVDNGIELPEELAFVYMTFLAKTLAHRESAAIITDNVKYDSFTNFVKANDPKAAKRNCFTQNIIELQVPRNLNDISFKELIQFRNANRELIHAFNLELDNVQQKISHGYSERDFIDSYNFVYSAMMGEISKFAFGGAAIPFAFSVLIQNPLALSVAYGKEILSGLGAIVGGVFGLRKGYNDIQNKRYCKKYLSRLENL